jgi:predicted HTH domain antitoxin
MAKQLTFNYPDNLPDALQLTKEQFEKEALTAMAVKLFEMKKISFGTAASLLGIDRVTFILLLKDWSINYINYPGEELLSDLAN